jgi:hypothetical protein
VYESGYKDGQESKIEEKGLIQVDQKFVGTMLWNAFDLVTFGVFEKPPKRKLANKTNNTNVSNSTNASNRTVF